MAIALNSRRHDVTSVERYIGQSTRAGNFIIGASGSEKQMLCGSSVARDDPTISAVNKIQKWLVCHSAYKSVFYGMDFRKRENGVRCSALLTCFLV